MSVKQSDVRVGTLLEADDGFTCLRNGEVVEVEEAPDGLFVQCSDGRHYLDGQIDGDEYIGFKLADDQ